MSWFGWEYFLGFFWITVVLRSRAILTNALRFSMLLRAIFGSDIRGIRKFWAAENEVYWWYLIFWHSDAFWGGSIPSIGAPASIQIFEIHIMIIIMLISKIWMEDITPMESIQPTQVVSECRNVKPYHETSFSAPQSDRIPPISLSKILTNSIGNPRGFV